MSAPLGWLQPTARIGMRARPLPTRPIAHALAQTRPPSNALEQHARYPAHPLNAFFHGELYRITPPAPDADSGPSSAPRVAPAASFSTPLAPSKGEREVRLPAVLPEAVFGHDATSRSYLAPELRLKSSHELHALWYVLLIERNRLATSRDEAKRLGLGNLMHLHRTNLGSKAHRVRKSMARIKLVLNERRLALIQAQQDVRQAAALDALNSTSSTASSDDAGLLDAAAAKEGTEAEGEEDLYEDEVSQQERERRGQDAPVQVGSRQEEVGRL